MFISPFELFYLISVTSAVAIALFLSLVLYSYIDPKRGYFRWILPVLALSIATNATLGLLRNADIVERSISEPFQLLIGPVLYFYLQFLNKREVSTKRKLWHLLPFFVAAIIFVGFMIHAAYPEPLTETDHFVLWLLSLVAYVQLWGYYFLCRRSLQRYQNQLLQSCSGIEKLGESWVGNALLALLLGYTGLSVVYLLNHGPLSISTNQSLAMIFAVLSFYISYATLRFSFAFINEPVELPPSRYEKSGLDDATAKAIADKLQSLMRDEKPFLDPDLKIAALASRLDVAVHHLSQVINTGQGGRDGKNFYDFVNAYRVQAVQAMFKDPAFDDKSILDIAFESGFTAKATFNRVFKKYTGKTPLEYRKDVALKK